ncbi:MAG: NfeD family protein [Colwellia sp.]|uniref:NfeD family protein n=1 Tax=Colwellia sp. TaxID=56799 RepID=UPI0025C3514A|nr:NfeD family protein [Colwellia sp.]NQZ25520.1 NfeD family protein [Colwellia sp.]
MQTFLENHQLIWYAIAGLSLVLELGLMGLSGPLLFFAIASAITGVLISLGLIDGWQSEILVVGVLSAVITLLLWKPLKKMQNSRSKTDNSSDMIGLQVQVSDDITKASGSIRYSGINWPARLADDVNIELIENNSQCTIVAITGNTMLVAPID